MRDCYFHSYKQLKLRYTDRHASTIVSSTNLRTRYFLFVRKFFFSRKRTGEFFFDWLAPLFVGLYIAFYSPLVLAKELPLGTFLATISVFREVSSNFVDGYKGLKLRLFFRFFEEKYPPRSFNGSPLKGGWKTILSFGMVYFQGLCLLIFQGVHVFYILKLMFCFLR